MPRWQSLVAFAFGLAGCATSLPHPLVTGAGPNLKVIVDNTDSPRFSFTVTGDERQYRAVVAKADLSTFRIVSRGGAGRPGSDGRNGMDGTPGSDGFGASCPSTAGTDGSRGGDGSNGGDGGNGGDGDDGGDIEVEVDCGAAGCSPAVIESLRGIIASEGGPGGSGGAGGLGGRGGRGGIRRFGNDLHRQRRQLHLAERRQLRDERKRWLERLEGL